MSVNQVDRDNVGWFSKSGKDVAGFKPNSVGEVTVTPALGAGVIASVSAVSQGFTVTITATTDATHYLIEYNKTSEPTVKSAVVTATSPKTVSGLTGSTEYKVRVKPLAAEGTDVYPRQGTFSADSTVTTNA